jgi:hypothetical protein
MYDVYRYNDLVARVRVTENGTIEWAYGQEWGDWQGFWWSNEVKRILEQLIQEFPRRGVLAASEFTMRRQGN